MSEEIDTAIVGGGIIGTAIAYHLVREGQKVILIDADHKGKATKAGAGIISAATTFAESDQLYELLLKSSLYYPELDKELEEKNGRPTSFEFSEEVVVAYDDKQIEMFEVVVNRILERQKINGFPPSEDLFELSIDEFKEKFPDLSEPKRALYFAKAAKIDGSEFSDSMLEAAKSDGLELISGQVASLSIDDKGICDGVCFRHATVKAKNTVIAGGAWSRTFENQIGVKLPLFPQRGQIAHLSINETQNTLPIIITLSDYYCLNWGASHLVIGATREDESGFEPRNTVKGIQQVLKHGMQMIPSVSDAEIIDIRVGLRPYSIDKLPMIGPIAKHPGLWVATGHGPLGLTTAPYTGKLVADGILARSNSELDAFSLERFND